MGWSVQGYYKDPGELTPSWHVETSGGDLDEIVEHNGFNPLDKENQNLVEIYYGNGDLKLFRGLVNTTDTSEIERLLSRFDDLPVYADKWFPERKSFEFKNLKFWTLNNWTAFVEAGSVEVESKVIDDLISRLTDRKEEWSAELEKLKETTTANHA